MKRSFLVILILFPFHYYLFSQTKPNIVLIFPDNLGIGEVNSYGGVRNVATPNIDQIGKEGIRFTNFNVEYSCVPSRAAIMTGRYATRTGENYFSGLTLWEVTIAEALRSQGYATALFGKWDLGGPNWYGKREPTQQGFDEWYGIPGTSHVSQYTSFEGFNPKINDTPFVWQGNSGTPSQKVKPFDINARRTIDREAAERVVSFMEKNAKIKKPFFVYYPITQLHFPALPHPDKAGATGAGDIGDAMADVDHNTGLVLQALKRLGIENNTLVIWCTDNGAELRRPWRGSPGPWRGYYNSAMEGGIRTPCMIRWSGHIKPGQVSNEIVHEVDLFATIANAVSAPEIIPSDRAFDGKNQLTFFEGKQIHSNRESVIYMNGTGQVMAVKWHDWKMWYYFRTELPDAEPNNLVRLFDLRVDPTEETDVKDYYPWVISRMDSIVKEYEASLSKYPRVPADQPDPYAPSLDGTKKNNEVFSRTDRISLSKRSDALPNPDFSGAWSTSVLETRSPLGLNEQRIIPTLGSGWGDKITIKQNKDLLEVEKVFFTARDLQPLLHLQYALNSKETINPINMGRADMISRSTTAWEGNRLVITTWYPYQEPTTNQKLKYKVTQTLWLASTPTPPFEPVLVIETAREAAPGGVTSVNRTIYTRGYR